MAFAYTSPFETGIIAGSNKPIMKISSNLLYGLFCVGFKFWKGKNSSGGMQQ